MPFSKEQAAGETLYCVVCGEGSCRKAWARSRGAGKLRFVACARHTDVEFNKACQRATVRAGKTLSEKASAIVGPPPNDTKSQN